MTVTDPKEIQSNKILYSNLKVYTVGTYKRLKTQKITQHEIYTHSNLKYTIL